MPHMNELFPSNSIKRRVAFVDLKREYSEIKEEINSAIAEVIESGIFVNGEHSMNFEKKFTDYIGTKYAVSVNSGSDALYLSLKTLNLTEKDEVITVANSFVSTVDAIVRNNSNAVIADIDPLSFNIDIEDLKRKITNKTKAIIPVHLYGQPANMEEIMEIALEYDLKVVEDSCQAHGAEYKGSKVGSFGDLGAFSFYPTKNIGAYGDSGIVTTNDYEIYSQLIRLRNYGSNSKYHHSVIGMNSRMDEIQASILNAKLKHLDEWNDLRRRAARKYSEFLEGSRVSTPVELQDRKHVYHIYAVRSQYRDNLQAKLSNLGIQTIVHYPVPIHKQEAYSHILAHTNVPFTEKAAEEILSLPIFPQIRDDEIEYVSEAIANA